MLIFALLASFVCSASAWLGGGLLPGTRSHFCQYLHVERRLSGSIGQVSSAVKVLRASASSENQNLEDGLMALQLPMKPSADYPPEEVLRFVLTGLKFNDTPKPNTGLRRWFAFSNDQCRCSIAVWDSWKQDRDNEENWADNFIKHARNPTFQAMLDMQSYECEPVNIIPATETRGGLATQITHIKTKKGEIRRFLWTLEQERRPPMQGCWLIRQSLYTKNAIELTV